MKLSVLIITYNHEKFIAQALDGVLMQDVDFDFEIVIGEDFSTDNTRQIVSEYQRRHPDKIRLLLPEKNIGANRNFIATYRACRGAYVAMLEGDDFWADPMKLRVQAAFLDENPQFVMCFTDCSVVNEDGVLTDQVRVPERMKRTISQRDITFGTPPTLTVMFRNHLIDSFPKEIYRIVNVDMFLSCMLTEFGDAGYIDNKTACYRVHGGGIWSLHSGEYRARNNLQIRKMLLMLCGSKHRDVLVPEVAGYYQALLSLYREERMLIKLFLNYASYALFRLRNHRAFGQKRRPRTGGLRS